MRPFSFFLPVLALALAPTVVTGAVAPAPVRAAPPANSTAPVAASAASPTNPNPSQPAPALRLARTGQYITISGGRLPGPVLIHYIEAYCRPGSTDRGWGAQTVIAHRSELLTTGRDGAPLRIRDTLADGVVVEHTITATADEVDFRLVARNPTAVASQAHWAQPCVRLDRFTGASIADAQAVQPAYIRQCFLFIGGQLTRLPTAPWATAARYTPGQVYVPAHVDRADANPRPLSVLVPSSGLCGAYSADGKIMLAVAWEPYQEIFQGVRTCLHNDFRIGGLAPGETKTIRGKLYIVPTDEAALVARFERDFPEQAASLKQPARK